jgi:hypothetical protein
VVSTITARLNTKKGWVLFRQFVNFLFILQRLFSCKASSDWFL